MRIRLITAYSYVASSAQWRPTECPVMTITMNEQRSVHASTKRLNGFACKQLQSSEHTNQTTDGRQGAGRSISRDEPYGHRVALTASPFIASSSSQSPKLINSTDSVADRRTCMTQNNNCFCRLRTLILTTLDLILGAISTVPLYMKFTRDAHRLILNPMRFRAE